MNLSQIQYFLTVANYLNFTEAARSLHITQPTLSNAIAALENELGFELFIRTKKYVRLTPAGVVLYKDFGNLSHQVAVSIEKARKANEGSEGVISIGCLEAIDTALFLPKIISRFSKIHPKVKFNFERHSFRTLREKLLAGELDIIFTFSFELETMSGILWDSIYKSRAVIAVPVSNPLADRGAITLEDVKDEVFSIISPSESPAGANSLLNLCKHHGFSPSEIKYCPNLESLLLCLESGMGVALLDKSIKFRDTSNIKFFDVPGDEGNIDVVLAWKKDNFSPTLPLFINFLLDMPASDFNL